MIKALALHLVAMTVSIAMAGCMSASLSRPYVDPASGWKSEDASRAQKIAGPDVGIYVKASNRISRASDETQRPQFGISLYFEPLVDDLDFNPQNVSLLVPGHPPLVPSKVVLQFAGNNQGLDIWDCGRYPPHDFGPAPQYRLRRGFCADLYFAIRPPSPDSEFALQINGLSRKGVALAVPELRFKKGEALVRIFSN